MKDTLYAICGIGALGLFGMALNHACKESDKESKLNKKRKYMGIIDNLLKTKRLAGIKGLNKQDVETLNQSITACKSAVNAIDKELGLSPTFSSVDVNY